MRIGMAAALCGLLTASSSDASPGFNEMLDALRGTMSVQSLPHRAGGKLLGCTLVFDNIYQDWSYRQGKFLKVTGNIGIMVFGEQMGANLKVVVHEIDASGSQLAFTPSPPSRAYLIGNDLATNLDTLVQAGESDTPGALFSIFQLSPTLEMAVEAVEANTLTVGFNSMGGDTDMQMKIELDVIDVDASGLRTRSETAKSNFLDCLVKLFES